MSEINEYILQNSVDAFTKAQSKRIAKEIIEIVGNWLTKEDDGEFFKIYDWYDWGKTLPENLKFRYLKDDK